MIVEQIFSDKPIKNDLRTYDNTQKIATGRGDDYATGCLLDYNYFKKHYNMISIDLSKQQALDVDPKSIQKTNFTGNLVNQNKNKTTFFIIEEAKKIFTIFTRNCESIVNSFAHNYL